MGRRRDQTYDAFPTPEEAIGVVLDRVGVPGPVVVEPCAGDGRILKAICSRYPTYEGIAVEIDERWIPGLRQVEGVREVYHEDFLQWRPSRAVHCYITNPPFSQAQAIVDHALTLSEGRIPVIMLLRLGFLAGQQRRRWWETHPPSQLVILSKRPRFVANAKGVVASDYSDYAWMCWNVNGPAFQWG